MAKKVPMEVIREEYITSEERITYRELAEKYHRNLGDIGEKASQEGWVEQREQYQNRIRTERREKLRQGAVDSATEIASTAKLLLEKLRKNIESDKDITATEASRYATALDKIKGVLDIRTAEDMEEQRARIDKLRKDTERGDQSASITVTLEGGMAEYGR